MADRSMSQTRPAGWKPEEKTPDQGSAKPDDGGAGEANTAAKPNDDRAATEQAAAQIEAENNQKPSDSE